MANNGSDKRALAYLFLTFLLCVLFLAGFVAICAVPAESQTGGVVFRVRNFGGPFAPVVHPYQNNPELLTLSYNFMSIQPGSRQLRTGITQLIDYDSMMSIMLDPVDSTTKPIDAIRPFYFKNDSSALVFCSRGLWYWSYWAERKYGRMTWIGGRYFYDTNVVIREIRPYSPGTITLNVTDDTIYGTGTRFVRDIAPGDMLFAEAFQDSFTVLHVISDTRLIVDSNWGMALTSEPYSVRRWYQDGYWAASDSTFAPFLLQSGDLMYSGTPLTPTQIIFKDDEDSLRMRTLGIVDSFYIDTIYTRYPADTASFDTVYHRNWEILASGDTVVRMLQIVSRSKIGVWQYDQWLSNISDGPEAYYVRLGYQDSNVWDAGKFFQIAGNTDTSLFLYAWYTDDSTYSTAWSNKVFKGHGLNLGDWPDSSVIEGTWGYIYASCGNARTVLADDSTDTIKILSRGAMFMLVDSTPPISPDTFYTGMYFIRLTGDDVGFPAYVETQGYKKTRGEKASCRAVEQQGYQPYLGQYEVVLSKKKVDNGRLGCWYEYVIVDTTTKYQVTRDAEFLGRRSFPIRFAEQDGDTLFFTSGIASDLRDTTIQTTANWELIRVSMPWFSGIVEWNNPPQLVGWGDSTGGSILSFSNPGDPWNWSVQNDVMVGQNPSEPIVSCLGYDDQLVIFKAHSMIAFDGSRFSELSMTDGLVGPRAAIGLNKEIYWLDVDGVKRMKRRDFSGYTIEKISTALDPILNAWNYQYYGTDVVYTTLNPRYRYLSVMAHDQRNQHLYLFFPDGSNTKNTQALTYNLQSGEWDGVHNIRASDAVWTNVRDTSRIVFGSPDSAMILALDYGWRDLPSKAGDSVWTGIDGILRGGKFWLTDESGWPVDSKVGTVRLFWRGAAGAMDTARVKIVGEDAMMESFALNSVGPVSIKDTVSIFRPSADKVSRYWYWEITTEGDHYNGNIFMPYMMEIELIPTGRDD